MSHLFIVNPTLQNRELQVRLGERQMRILRIPAGAQKQFPDDLEGPLLGKVIKQIERAGGVLESDVKAIRTRFSLVYRVSDSAPIPTGVIDKAAKQDEAVRQELSGNQLEQSAIRAFGESKKVGGQEVSFELTQVNDQDAVKGGVDTEFVVTSKRGVNRRETTRKR